MHAVIHRSDELAGAAMMPIAGRPLIARQLQWLRAGGHGPVAVELGLDEVSAALGRWLREEDVLGVGVVMVTARHPLGPEEVARRAGFPEGLPVLGLPANAVVGGEVIDARAAFEAGERTIRLDPPAALAGEIEGAELRVFGAGAGAAGLGRAWGVKVRSWADALTLGVAALRGRNGATGILVHAAEIEAGVWVGRGALVEAGAMLRAPVLLGRGAVVRAGATVGPSVCIGDRAVIDSGTRIAAALVSAGTIVGEALDLGGVAVDAEGLTDLRTGARLLVDDPLLLTSRDGARTERAAPQVMGLVLLVVVTPAAILERVLSIALGGVSAGLPARGTDALAHPA